LEQVALLTLELSPEPFFLVCPAATLIVVLVTDTLTLPQLLTSTMKRRWSRSM
jgi:hypothetical protein